MTYGPLDLRGMIPAEALGLLRASYDPNLLCRTARAATTAPFPPAAPFVDALVGGFFEDRGLLRPAERELLIVALFANTVPAWMLAVHVYVGLMEGLCVEQIAGAVLLSAMYKHGLAAYTQSISVVERTLRLLKEAAGRGEEERQTAAVISSLQRGVAA